MSVAFAVSDMIERIRVRCNLPEFTADTQVSTSDILTLVQESARRLSSKVDRSAWFFATTADLTTLANIPVVSLPTNFASLLQLSWNRGQGQVYELREANLEEVGPDAGLLTWESSLPSYRLTGNTVEFFPNPTAVYDLVMRYTTGAFITDAADTLFGQIGWDEWILYDCCCKVRQSQEKDYAAFASERAMVEQDIQDAARKRDRVGTRQPRDTRNSDRSDSRRDWDWYKL